MSISSNVGIARLVVVSVLLGAPLIAGCVGERGEDVGVNRAAQGSGPFISLLKPVRGNIYTASFGQSVVDITSSTVPVFSETFPTIEFNPDDTILGNPATNQDTRPFTDVTFDPGTQQFTGTVVVQGRGGQAQAGVTTALVDLFAFQAGITGTLHASDAGDVTISVTSDDGFILGVNGGVTSATQPMPVTLTPLIGAPVLISNNQPTSPATVSGVLTFPAAGDYAFEIDYFESFGGALQLLLAEDTGAGSVPVPAALALAIAPNVLGPNTVGTPQSFTVQASDATGVGISSLPVTVEVRPFPPVAASPQLAMCSPTDASGSATCTYTRTTTGDVTLQAKASSGSSSGLSNVVLQTWN